MRALALLFAIGCASHRAAPRPPAVATCAERACLEANTGEILDLAGTFRAATGNSKLSAQEWLVLDDGTKVMLHDDAKPSPDRDGERMVLRARVYTRDIPERYRIYQAMPVPYAVEIY